MRLQASLFSTPGAPPVWSTSFTTGPDAVCLDTLIGLHAVAAPVILDATFGHGAMWVGSAYAPDLTMDIRDLPRVTNWDDFTVMRTVEDESVDVIVFDPPHLPNAAASAGSSGIWRDRYGITDGDPRRAGDSIAPLFLPFLLQAHRVLRPAGIVLAKIADIIHNHQYQWQMCAFVEKAREALFHPCDLMVRVDPRGANLKSSKWKRQEHLRHAHVYWIVARKDTYRRAA